MGNCVGKKEIIIIVNKPKNERIKKNRVNSELYEKKSISSSLINELKTSFPSINSTEFSKIQNNYNNGFDDDMNNGNTFEEILDLINIKED